MHVCMYACMHVCVCMYHTYIPTYVRTYIHTHIHMYILVYVERICFAEASGRAGQGDNTLCRASRAACSLPLP